MEEVACLLSRSCLVKKNKEILYCINGDSFLPHLCYPCERIYGANDVLGVGEEAAELVLKSTVR